MGTEIRATRREVWRALVDPSQVPHWRPGFVAGVERDASWPDAGSHWTWRCDLKGLPILVRHRPRKLVRGEQLRAQLEVGLFRAEEVLGVHALGPHSTRLSVRIACRSEMALLGSCLDRFATRRFATELASATAQAVRDWCERGRGDAVADPGVAGPSPEQLSLQGFAAGR